MVYTVDGSPCALCARQPAQAPRAHPCRWFARLDGVHRLRSHAVPGTQRLAVAGHGHYRAARSHPGPRHAHDSTGPATAADAAGTEAWRTVSPVRVHSPDDRASMSLGVGCPYRHALNRAFPNSPPRPSRSHPMPAASGERLGRVARRSGSKGKSLQTSSGSVAVTARASRRWASGRTRRRRRSD